MRSIRLASLVAALLPVSAMAVPVTYEFTGRFTSYMTDGDIADPPFPYATEFFGSFTLEDSTAAFVSEVGLAAFQNAITAASISIGAGGSLGIYEYTGLPLAPNDVASRVVFLDDYEYMGNPPFDQFVLAVSLGALPGDPAGVFRSLGIGLGSFDTSTLPALSLTDPLPTARLLSAGVSLTYYYEEFDVEGNSMRFEAPGGTLTSLTQVPVGVPEPSTLALFAAGILGLGLRRRRTA